MKALVISGGGSKGAFAGGVAEHLIHNLGKEYDIFIGSSTGSLLIPLLSIGKIDALKQVYTNVTHKDIYNICPFRIKRLKDGSIKTSINHFNTLKMFLKGKKTFGEHKALRKTILKTVSEEDFDMISKNRKKVIATVSNMTRGRIEYKYAKDCTYDDFIDWMWISASFVPFMSLVDKNGYEYADGGFGNYVPVEEAINIGATEIDAIVLQPRTYKKSNIKTRNAFDVLMQTMVFMQNQIVHHDLLIGHLEGIYNKAVNVNFIFTPRNLTDQSFVFDPIQMREWWQEGFEYAKKNIN